MPRSLRVLIACDNCDEVIDSDSDMHEGALAITINGGALKQIDLCSACLRGDQNYLYVMGLLSLYDQADSIAEPQRKTRGPGSGQSKPSTCPACGHVAGSPQGLGRHARNVHGMSVAQMRFEQEQR